MRASEFITESYDFFDEIVTKIKSAIPAEEIWFHGSRATGNEREDSDWDILVIVPHMSPDDYINTIHILRKIAKSYENFDIQPTYADTQIAQIARKEGTQLA